MTQRVQFGIGVPNGGDFADPRRLMKLAEQAEQAGWDGVFLWDHLVRRPPWVPMVDPWIALAAIATATDRVTLGPMITPLARRRAQVVARQSVTLDHLCGGRLRLGVGLGAPVDEFTRFGESGDNHERAGRLDESLTVLRSLWSGEVTSFEGDYLSVDEVAFTPRPVNGTIPVWVGGGWPGSAPFARAARYQGVWPMSADGGWLSIEAFGECLNHVRDLRAAISGTGAEAEPFDACFVNPRSDSVRERDLDDIGRLSEMGMTWWIESVDRASTPFEEHLERVAAGPPHATTSAT